MGDELWVSVTPDSQVNKGPHRPVFKDSYRAHMLSWLRCVDRAAIYTSTLDALRLVKPAIFVKGKEYDGKIEKAHLDFCKDNGIEIKFTDTPKFSSTALLRYYESRSR